MAKGKRKVPGINASSTADISFILLIFFLVTTSMDSDKGLARRLPAPPENEQQDAQIDIKERNLLEVRVNAAGDLMCGGDLIELDQLCDRAKEFIKNEANSATLPEKHTKNIPLLGNCNVTDKHVISVQTDRGTKYNVYFQVQNAFTFTKYDGMDPEIGYGTSDWVSGIDLGYYPRPRTYLIGVNLKF